MFNNTNKIENIEVKLRALKLAMKEYDKYREIRQDYRQYRELAKKTNKWFTYLNGTGRLLHKDDIYKNETEIR